MICVPSSSHSCTPLLLFLHGEWEKPDGERLEGVEWEVGLELDRTDEQRIGDQGLGTGSPVTRYFSL